MLPISSPKSWPVTRAGMHSLQCLMIFNATCIQNERQRSQSIALPPISLPPSRPFFFLFLNIIGEQFLPEILLRKTSRAWNRSEFSKPESIASMWTEHVPGHQFGPLAKAPQSLRPKPPAQTTASELRFPIPRQNTNFRGGKKLKKKSEQAQSHHHQLFTTEQNQNP